MSRPIPGRGPESIADLLDALLQPPDTNSGDVDPHEIEQLKLESLDFVKTYIPTIDKARDTIIQEMESMVVNGLADLVSPASSQTSGSKFDLGHEEKRS